MAKATGLISSLFNIASSEDMPFCQLQQLQCCIMVLLKLTFELHSFICMGDDLRYVHVMTLVQDYGKCRASRQLRYSSPGMLPNMFEELEMKRNVVIHHD